MSTPLTDRGIGIAYSFLFLAGSVSVALPGHAAVGLRVEAHPITASIDAYVRFTAEGESVAGLTVDDFTVTLDGRAVEEFSLALPPSQDSSGKVSVVLVIEVNGDGNKPAYVRFVNELGRGNFVSVVKYQGDIERIRFGGLAVLPFTELDDGMGSEQVINFIQEEPAFPFGSSRFLIHGLTAALSQFDAASATLPDGPKAILTVNCCIGSASLSEVVARANAGGIAIFDMGRVEWSRYPDLAALMRALAANTGGVQVKLADGAPARDALPSMSSWLKDGYRLAIPHDAISDCDRHRLAVTVRGESTSVSFSRCDVTPEEFLFRERLDVPVASRVRSNPVTIAGIDSAVPIRVYGGQYSIGCGTEFTSEPGRILPGQSVCVRHVSASSGGLDVYTLLIVGGVSSWFRSSTIFP